MRARSTYSNRNYVGQQQNCIIQTIHQVIPAPVTYKEGWKKMLAIFGSIPLCFLLSTSAYTARAHAALNMLGTSTSAAPLPLAQPQPWPSCVPRGCLPPSPPSWLQQSPPGHGQGATSLPCSGCRKAAAAPPRGTCPHWHAGSQHNTAGCLHLWEMPAPNNQHQLTFSPTATHLRMQLEAVGLLFFLQPQDAPYLQATTQL